MSEIQAIATSAPKRRSIRRRNGVYAPLKVSLSAAQLLALQSEANKRKFESPHKLAAELLGVVISDKLYAALLDN